jgi:hypothetical protein
MTRGVRWMMALVQHADIDYNFSPTSEYMMSSSGVTMHPVVEGDASDLSSIEADSVHLVCTSSL